MKTDLRVLDCDRAREMMFDYIDGVSSKGDTLRLEVHLKDCDCCRAELEDRRAMLALIGKCAEPVPEGLCEAVMKNTENIKQESKAKVLMRRIASGGALTAAAAAVTLLIVGRGLIFGGSANMETENAAPEQTVRLTAQTYSSPGSTVDGASGYGAADDAYDAAEYIYSAVNLPEAAQEDADADGFCADTADAGNGSAYLLDSVSPGDATAETTVSTAALKVSSPVFETTPAQDFAVLVTGTSAAVSSVQSPVDLMFEKLYSAELGIIVCDASALSVHFEAEEYESVILDGRWLFDRYVVTTDAMRYFTECLASVKDSGTHYRASAPDGAFAGCEILLYCGETE